ncbi:OLC1v1020960C1 [Oldenlandia corymbosa var. corymbosa]|uniref:OLC1v1020960C1 n=1 Tax=Oldenlandia corymbosa var. corymbosa TaxID=529605 RepID=A0AAV1BW37_OLDCO|nr:OLC1v1020960C1 [Oldenlandia corymbosa var. corymbosa]
MPSSSPVSSLSSNLDYPTSVFESVQRPNSFLWTALIEGYCRRSSSLHACIGIFKQMMLRAPAQGEDQPVNIYPLPSLIRSCANAAALREGQVIHGLVLSARKFFDEMPAKDAVSYSSMIDGYAKAGDMGSAMMLFEQSGRKTDLVLWSALISGFTQNGLPREAIEMFDKI